MDVQILGALTISALAFFGFNYEIHPSLVIWIAAIVGSIQATTARIKRGYLKGFFTIVWTLIAGVTAGILIGKSVGHIMGLTDNVAVILPIYIFALIGGRLISWLIVDVDIAKIGESIVGRFFPTKEEKPK